MGLFLRHYNWSSGPLAAVLIAMLACGGNGTEPVIQTPTQLQKIAGDAQVGIAGQQLPSPLVVEVTDASGSPVAGAVVTFAVSQGGGSVGASSVTTDSEGRVSTPFTTGPIAGAPQLVAASVTSAALSAVFSATAVAGPPASITIFAGNTQQAAAGTPVPTAPAVLLRDINENPVPGVAVLFEVVSGGGSVTGAAAVTANNGIAQVGSWILGTSGPNVLRATAAGSGISGNPVTFTAVASISAFDIVIRVLGAATSSQLQAAAQAEARWETLITGDLANARVTADTASCGPASPPINEIIDDLVILMSFESIDGPGGVLASAGPCFIRNSDNLSVLGAMRLDTADLEVVEAEGLLSAVILHEMGHVLGFGALWNIQGLLADASLPPTGGTDPHFTGAQAIAAFNEAGGAAYTGNKVPVENTGGEGTADGHWRESVLINELMTGFIDAGVNPLSRVTVGSLADQGYTVNLSGADLFSLSLALRNTRPRATLHLGNDLLALPIRKVDAAGRVVSLFLK